MDYNSKVIKSKNLSAQLLNKNQNCILWLRLNLLEPRDSLVIQLDEGR